jgi:ribosome-associated translation inhibitor RaiA
MQIEVTTDNHVKGGEGLTNHVTDLIEDTLDRFGNRVTWVEVHIGDENSSKAGGAWCGIHAKLAGLDTINVDAQADVVHLAVDAAATKLLTAIERVIGKKESSKKRLTMSAEVAESED